MDLSYSKEEVIFRQEVRDFFQTAVPKETKRKLLEGRHIGKEDMVTWQRILNKKGWAVTHWPKEWGGTGWTPVQHYIFNEELQMAPAPQPGRSPIEARSKPGRGQDEARSRPGRTADEAGSRPGRGCRAAMVGYPVGSQLVILSPGDGKPVVHVVDIVEAV